MEPCGMPASLENGQAVIVKGTRGASRYLEYRGNVARETEAATNRPAGYTKGTVLLDQIDPEALTQNL